MSWYSVLEAESTSGHMELSDDPGKNPQYFIWCDQIMSGLNLLLHNNLYFTISDVARKVAFLVLPAVSLVTAPPFEILCEAHCLKLCKCILQFYLSHSHSISFLLTPSLFFEMERGSHMH
jgi:hypothetical protein